MNIVILDVETTGDNHLIDEICQMSYIILNKELEIIKAKNFFFEVDYVHFKSTKDKLNIDKLKKLSNNQRFKDRYEEIFNDLNGNLIVCHKCEHDINFLKSEFIRVNNKNNFRYEEFCTMMHYRDILKIPSENYGFKYPKLTEVMPYLNVKRGDIHNSTSKIFNLDETITLDFHDSRIDVTSVYLIAINTVGLKEKYNSLLLRNEKKELEYNNKIYKIKCEEIKEVNNVNINQSKDSSNESTEKSDEVKNHNNIKDLLSFKGKLNRHKYNNYLILSFSCYFIFTAIVTGIYIYTPISFDVTVVILSVLEILKSYTLIVLAIKRLRYRNINLWMIVLQFIPIVNLIFMINQSFAKDKVVEKNLDKYKNKKIYIRNTILIIMSIISIIYIGVVEMSYYEYDYRDDGSSTYQQEYEDIIDRVSNYEEEDGYTAQELINDSLEGDEVIYGWYVEDVDEDTYFVAYEFDDDDNEDNGTYLYCYEYYEPTDRVTPIIDGELEQMYIDLGYIED